LAWNLQEYAAGNKIAAREVAMVIQMNDYRKAKTVNPAAQGRLEEEALCVNWNPAFSVVALSCYQTPQELSPKLPEDFAVVEPAFIDRVYALATQI
jgi:hypothetical protein